MTGTLKFVGCGVEWNKIALSRNSVFRDLDFSFYLRTEMMSNKNNHQNENEEQEDLAI